MCTKTDIPRILRCKARIVSAIFACTILCVTNTSAQSVGDLLQSASPGSRVIVTERQGDILLKDISFDQTVIVEFASGTSISSLYLRNVRGVHFKNLRIDHGPQSEPKNSAAVRVYESHALTFSSLVVTGGVDATPLNDGTGMIIEGSGAILIEGSEFAHLRNGIMLRDSKNATIQNNLFHYLLADGVDVSGSKQVTLSGNVCTNFFDRHGSGVHPDCIQLLAGSRKRANEDVRIIDNVVRKGKGAQYQGIFVRSIHDGIHHKNILIKNNFIEQSHPLAIAIQNVDGGRIINNIVREAPVVEHTPHIRVRAPVSDVEVIGNIAPLITAPAHVLVMENKTSR